MEPPPPPERLEEVPPSPDSNLSPTQPQPPASAATLNNGPPVKPPRPKVPIYANIDDVERQTHGAASDSGSSAANPGLRSFSILPLRFSSFFCFCLIFPFFRKRISCSVFLLNHILETVKFTFTSLQVIIRSLSLKEYQFGRKKKLRDFDVF